MSAKLHITEVELLHSAHQLVVALERFDSMEQWQESTPEDEHALTHAIATTEEKIKAYRKWETEPRHRPTDDGGSSKGVFE